MISQIVTKWQPFFKIQDGGDRHLKCLQICISEVIDIFQIKDPMFSLILVTIGQIQDCGSRHLEKYTSGYTVNTRNEFLVYNCQLKM